MVRNFGAVPRLYLLVRARTDNQPRSRSTRLSRGWEVNVDLFEYQARDLFEAHGVPVLAGIVADTPEAAKAAAEQLGGGDRRESSGENWWPW